MRPISVQVPSIGYFWCTQCRGWTNGCKDAFTPPCEAGERWRGTTLLTNTAKRTDPSRGWWAFRLFCPRRAARSASISRLLTAVSGLTVRFYWDCICSAKIPSPQRLEWESAGAVCSSELLAGDGRVVANIYSLGCFWGPVQAGSPPVLRELCASRACRPRIVLCPFPSTPSATPYIVATTFIAHNICLFLWVLDA